MNKNHKILCAFLVVFHIVFFLALYGRRNFGGLNNKSIVIDQIQGRESVALIIDRGGLTPLLMEHQIQQHLGLSNDQVVKLEGLIKDAGRRLGQQAVQISKTVHANDVQGHDQNPAGLLKRYKDAIHRERDRAVRKILTDTQYSRLSQIGLQSHGFFANIVEPDIASRINLTSNQRIALTSIISNMNIIKSNIELERGAFASKAEIEFRNSKTKDDSSVSASFGMSHSSWLILKRYEQRSREVELDAIKKGKAILNSEQLIIFNELVGEPFDFAKL